VVFGLDASSVASGARAIRSTFSRGGRVHKFLIHRAGDHVGVATSDIGAGERVVGVYMDDDSTVEVEARGDVPLGHKIAVEDCEAGGDVTEYGARIGVAPDGLGRGDYVHTHNLKSARW
jgi:(2R)-sulfolactate sulfo-lyase subunit alpha